MNDAVQPRLGFRADINGLRAIAVLAVLAYHFGVAPFRSGFVGVDVFFVISGYLMTGIVLGRLDRGTFSVPGFYLDRARRIVPALVVLVAAVLLLGFWILLPDEYLILAKHAASSVTFLSNILYRNEAGYFDPGLDQKWLLHTWSLSVEWQFYLLYPLLLLAIVKFLPKRWLKPVLATLALASFANMIALSLTIPDTGFFLLPPRAWEMLVGGLVFTSPALTGTFARPAQLAGLALILASTLAFTPAAWPNVWALLPVLGTALVILAARADSRLTGNPISAWVGINSYSIYLWHWPLVELLKRYRHDGEWPWILAALAASFVLGHLSWRFVERLGQSRAQKLAGEKPRIHTGRIAFDWRAHLTYAIPVAALVLVSLGIWKTRGLPQRFSAEVQAVAQDAMPAGLPEAADCFSHVAGVPAPCVLGAVKQPVLLTMLGDSHAESSLRAVMAAMPAGAKGGIAFNAYAACPPVLGAAAVKGPSQCGDFNRRFLEPQTVKRTTPLLLVSRWSYYRDNPAYRFAGGRDLPASLYASMCRLAAAGPTYANLPAAEFPFWVSRELQHRMIADPRTPEIVESPADHAARNAAVVAALQRAARDCGLKLLDPAPLICPTGACEGSRNHRALYRDEHHLSIYGAGLLVPMFRSVFAP